MNYPPKSRVHNVGIYPRRITSSLTQIIELEDSMLEVVPHGIFKALKRRALQWGMTGASIIVYEIPKSNMNIQDSE